MPLNKDVAAWLARQVPAESLSLAALRHQTDLSLITQQGEARDGHYQHSFTFPASDGHAITVRVYVPCALEQETGRPALIWAHGGGWCLGSLTAWDRPCRLLAENTGCVVFSVDYRLAPEHRWPVPLNDLWQALCWISDHATDWDLDSTQIAVGGDSAGGNLAAAVCLMARDRGGPAIYHQLLLYPALDASLSQPSYQTCGQGFGLTKEMMAFCWQHYLGQQPLPETSLISPLLLSSALGLPATTLLLCEYDPLRDEGEAFARRLITEGVNVNLHWLDGLIHGAMHMTDITPEAERCYTLSRFI
ncbi:alpha/beta hydrolase (plasmid) [Erwinia rhapontici]|uniref:alpha/beta hydrolase n=1 Tax=Erwinia rhapontici TaxID=55212 RepID=UPI003D363026